jgi:hypothetical protein
LQTINQTGQYDVSTDNRVELLNNDTELYFSYVVSTDQEFYLCAVQLDNGTSLLVQKFFIYVKFTPVIVLTVDNQIIDQNNTIIFNYGDQYTIICSAVNSKPNVSLSIFDTNNGISLSLNDQINPVSTNNCDQTSGLCTSIYQVIFQLSDIFNNMTSITCEAESVDSNFPLTVDLVRKVSVISTTTTSSTLVSSSLTSLSTLSTTTSSTSTEPETTTNPSNNKLCCDILF